MRRFDKSKHIENTNKKLEERSLKEKGLIKEERDYDDVFGRLGDALRPQETRRNSYDNEMRNDKRSPSMNAFSIGKQSFNDAVNYAYENNENPERLTPQFIAAIGKALKQGIESEMESIYSDLAPNAGAAPDEMGEGIDTIGESHGEGKVSGKFFNHILQGEDATEENAYAHARGLDWQTIESTDESYPYLDYIDTVNGVGIYHNYGHNGYYFTDETAQDIGI